MMFSENDKDKNSDIYHKKSCQSSGDTQYIGVEGSGAEESAPPATTTTTTTAGNNEDATMASNIDSSGRRKSVGFAPSPPSYANRRASEPLAMDGSGSSRENSNNNNNNISRGGSSNNNNSNNNNQPKRRGSGEQVALNSTD